MRAAWMIGAAAAAFAGAAGAQELVVEDAAARVVVIPEARRDVQVTITPGAARLPQMEVRRRGDRLIVDGNLKNRIDNCGGGWNLFGGNRNERRSNGPQEQRVDIDGVGRVRVADLPLITARVPLNADVAAGGAVWGRIGRTQNRELSVASCGDWSADSTGRLEISTAGSGDITVASARGDAEVSLAGSGDVRLGPVGGELDASSAGSGDIRAASVGGPVNASLAGSGDVVVDGGRTGPVNASIVGSGDVRIGGAAASVSASILGSGDVRVARSLGAIRRSVAGSGDVIVGR